MYHRSVVSTVLVAAMMVPPCHGFVPSGRVVVPPHLGAKVGDKDLFAADLPQRSNIVRFASDATAVPEPDKKNFLQKVTFHVSLTLYVILRFCHVK